jgi:DNA-directed RNA polymerase subunit RPC12/RpoP
MFNFSKKKTDYGFSEETKEFLKKMHGNTYLECKDCGEEFPIENKDGNNLGDLRVLNNAVCPKCGSSKIAYTIAHFFYKKSPWESFWYVPKKIFKSFLP